MGWKPKTHFSFMDRGACPNCGQVISLSTFSGQLLDIKSIHAPVDDSEPNFHCDNCDTDLVVDLELHFIVNSKVFRK